MSIAAVGRNNLTEQPSRGYRTVAEFDELEQIGEGTFGQVYKAREIATGEIVALKKLRVTDYKEDGVPVEDIPEIKILNALHHDNVVRLKEVVTSPCRRSNEEGDNKSNDEDDDIYMVFEYMEHDLSTLATGFRFTAPQIKCYMKQLLTGLQYCHANNVLHRDIKPSNVLVDNEGTLKLADFGLARTFENKDHPRRGRRPRCDHEEDANFTNCVVTLWYRPPELLLGETNYGPAVDVWSAGCVFAELLRHGNAIFPGKDEDDQIKRIFRLCGSPDEDNWPGASKIPGYKDYKPPARRFRGRLRAAFGQIDRHAWELVEQMLTLDPAQRISAEDALDSEYFWTEPLPADPKTLPKYAPSQEFRLQKKRQQDKELRAKRRKLQHSQPHSEII